MVVELIAGLGLCLWAALTVPGKFLSILPHSDENRYSITLLSLSLWKIVYSIDRQDNNEF